MDFIVSNPFENWVSSTWFNGTVLNWLLPTMQLFDFGQTVASEVTL